MASGGPTDPGSWNRYSYTRGDPANRYDPSGSYDCFASDGQECNGPVNVYDPGEYFPSGENGCPGGYYFSPSHGEWVPDSFGPGPTKPKPPPPPSCSLELEYAGVKSLRGTLNHAAVVVTDSFGYTFTMEGFPQSTIPPWGNLVPTNTAGNIGDTQWGPILTSSQDSTLCSQITAIETAENYYSNHEVAYLGWGPNSNSFAHWLLESGYVDQYFSAPPRTPGWDTPLYGTLWGIPGSGGR
jgi:hypothetical protein